MCEEGTKYPLFLSVGSFCRYRGTDNEQQKKQYNQTIKLQENSIVRFLWFFLWQRYLQKVPVCFFVPLDLKTISDETLSKF